MSVVDEKDFRIQELEKENEYLRELLSWTGMSTVSGGAPMEVALPTGVETIVVHRSKLIDLQKQVT